MAKDRQSLANDKLLANAGLVVEPREGLSVFTSYAQGFTMPDAGLILRAVRTPGQTVEQLVDLQPVMADNIESAPSGLSSSRPGYLPRVAGCGR